MFNGLPMTFTNPQQAARWDSFPGFGGTPAPSTRGTDAYVPANTHGASGRNYGMPGAPAPAPVPAPAPQPGGSGYGGQPMNYATPVGGAPQPLVAQVAGGQPVDWQSMLTNMFGARPQQQQYTPTQVAPASAQPSRIASFMANPAMQKFLPPNLLQAFSGGVQVPQFRRPIMAPGQPGLFNSAFRLSPAQNQSLVTMRPQPSIVQPTSPGQVVAL